MQVKIEDLQIGDEIIVPYASALKYLKVLRAPQIGKSKSWRPNVVRYKNVKCSTKAEITETKWKDYSGRDRVSKSTIYICSPEEHNIEVFQDLNYKTIWLVNRKNQ
jgi:hypothetical protein